MEFSEEKKPRRWVEKPRRSKRGDYIGAIVVSIIMLWVVNKIPGWHWGFIRDNYMVILWILNANLLVQIAGNAVMLLLEYRVVRRLGVIATEAASFVTQLVLYYIYPFDFSRYPGLTWLDWFIPLALIIGMVVSAVKVVWSTWRLVFP
jgi:hypothetical protein